MRRLSSTFSSDIKGQNLTPLYDILFAMQTKSQISNDKKGNYINKTQDTQVLRRPKKFLNIIKWLLKDSKNINTSCIGQTIFYSTFSKPTQQIMLKEKPYSVLLEKTVDNKPAAKISRTKGPANQRPSNPKAQQSKGPAIFWHPVVAWSEFVFDREFYSRSWNL